MDADEVAAAVPASGNEAPTIRAPRRERSTVIFSDADIVAMNKPSGLISHRSTLARFEKEFFIDEARAVTDRMIYLAHRLDRATSGVVLCAASKEIAGVLGHQFMGREIDKTYLGVVRGHCPEAGVIDQELDAPGKPEPKPAVTRYLRLATVEVPIAVPRYPTSRYSLIEITPETGRYQQIRRHLRDAAYPLAGDSAHGDGRHNRSLKIHFGLHRMLLHSWILRFDHPRSGQRMMLSAPLDQSWRRMLDAFGWREVFEAHALLRNAAALSPVPIKRAASPA